MSNHPFEKQIQGNDANRVKVNAKLIKIICNNIQIETSIGYSSSCLYKHS